MFRRYRINFPAGNCLKFTLEVLSIILIIIALGYLASFIISHLHIFIVLGIIVAIIAVLQYLTCILH